MYLLNNSVKLQIRHQVNFKRMSTNLLPISTLKFVSRLQHYVAIYS